MKIGKLNEKCPKCGCEDKTIKRDIEPEYQARATTGAVICSKCGYLFKSAKDEKCEEEE
jgi:Cys-rich peptide (TIGR04165 family)